MKKVLLAMALCCNISNMVMACTARMCKECYKCFESVNNGKIKDVASAKDCISKVLEHATEQLAPRIMNITLCFILCANVQTCM